MLHRYALIILAASQHTDTNINTKAVLLRHCLGRITTHWHQQQHQGCIDTPLLGPYYNTLTPASTPRLRRYALMTLAVSQHTDTSNNTKAVLLRPCLGRITIQWHQQKHKGYGTMLKCIAECCGDQHLQPWLAPWITELSSLQRFVNPLMMACDSPVARW